MRTSCVCYTGFIVSLFHSETHSSLKTITHQTVYGFIVFFYHFYSILYIFILFDPFARLIFYSIVIQYTVHLSNC